MKNTGKKSDFLLDDLPRGIRSKPPDKQITPRAVWASSEHILDTQALAYNPDKILLGSVEGNLIGLGDDRHMMTIAGSRAGKGVSAIIPNLLNYRGSMLVIDPKGELASITTDYRITLGQKVHVLDPFRRAAAWVEPFYSSFNPLATLQGDEKNMIVNAGLIADALVTPHGPYADPHWSESAKDVIEAVILHVATYPKYKGNRNLITVRRLLLEGVDVKKGKVSLSGILGLLSEMGMNKALDGFIYAMAVSIGDKPEEERGSIISTAQRNTKFLDLPQMNTVLKDNNLSLSELKTAPNGTTIYLCLPTGRMSLCNRWLRLFINLALESAENTTLTPDAKFSETSTGLPVIFCMDEFATLGSMKQIEIAAGQIAGFGVKLWPILQDITQLQSLYDKRWETFIGNSGIIQLFGNNDLSTLEFISKQLGQTSIVTENKSQTTHAHRLEGGTGESYSILTQPLLTSEEVSRYFRRNDPKRRQLLLWADGPALILQRVIYHDKSLPEYKHFTGKYRDWL